MREREDIFLSTKEANRAFALLRLMPLDKFTNTTKKINNSVGDNSPLKFAK